MCDDEIGVVGTINLDYRSLYLHFEDGVWIYRNKVIGDIKKDFTDTLDYCNPVITGILQRQKYCSAGNAEHTEIVCAYVVNDYCESPRWQPTCPFYKKKWVSN